MMKRMLFMYVAALAVAAGLMLFNRQWGGLMLIATLLVWFVQGVFANTGDRRI